MTQLDPSQFWRVFPHTYAKVCSKGLWKPFNYLVNISTEITKAIGKGNGRLIVEVPPRHGKSYLISHWVPCWFLDQYPTKTILLASYSGEFSASWGRKVRNEINNNPLITVKVSDDSAAAAKWETTEGGGLISTGIGGPLTGFGGNLLIIDDPIKNQEEASSETHRLKSVEWFDSTFYTRAEPDATIVILQTRWHEGDLAGYLKSEHADKWKVITYPAISENENDALGRNIGEALCPERYSIKQLKNIKIAVGKRVWASLYQQRPAPEGGNLVNSDWWKFYDELPTGLDQVVMALDSSFKGGPSSSYNVISVWGSKGPNKYLLDQYRRRMNFTQTIKALKMMVEKWPQASAKLIEEKANGAAIIETLKKEIPGIIALNPTESKEARLSSVSPQIEAGNVFLPKPKLAFWIDDFINEFEVFPNGKHDDQVDAAVYCIQYLSKVRAGSSDFVLPNLSRRSPWR